MKEKSIDENVKKNSSLLQDFVLLLVVFQSEKCSDGLSDKDLVYQYVKQLALL